MWRQDGRHVSSVNAARAAAGAAAAAAVSKQTPLLHEAA